MNIYLHASEEIFLVPVPGLWISSQLIQPAPDANLENSLSTFELLKSKKYTTENDNLCIIPVMPAVPPFIDETSLNEAQKHVEVSAPLKGSKSPYSDKKSVGFRSGSRSGIVLCKKVSSNEAISPSDWVIGIDASNGSRYIVDSEHGNIFVRAKGCGMWLKNNDLQFPGITLMDSFSQYAPEGQSVSEIRGVCFTNTSSTEIRVTSTIEENLKKIGFISGNHPLGFWIYKDLQNDITPLIPKTVSIFETYGDRRLESHLLAGLEKLLTKKYDDSFAKQVIDSISPLYENMKDLFPSTESKTYTKTYEVKSMFIKNKILDGSLYNFDNFEIEAFTEESLRKLGLVPTCDVYKAIGHLDKDFVNLAKLFGHLGFEAGKCLSVVHRSGYLWGSYFDHQPWSFHCNAHCDNLIVLTKEQCLSNKKTLQVLAPLDFDMAFKKENAINFYVTPPCPDPSYVTDTVVPEFNSMLSDIGGHFATSENVESNFSLRPLPPGLLCNVLWLLRDCAAYEFCKGYEKVKDERCKGNDISIDDMYKLINEGLNETINDNS